MYSAGVFGAGLAAGYLCAKPDVLAQAMHMGASTTPAAVPRVAPAPAAASPPGKAVEATTRWLKDEEGDAKFVTTVGPEQHDILIQPGPGGTHVAPMQTLLASAVGCTSAGVLAKLQDVCTVEAYRVETTGVRGTIPSQPKSVFSAVTMKIVVTSPDADADAVNKIVAEHKCSVVCNMSGATKFVVTAEVERTSMDRGPAKAPAAEVVYAEGAACRRGECN